MLCGVVMNTVEMADRLSMHTSSSAPSTPIAHQTLNRRRVIRCAANTTRTIRRILTTHTLTGTDVVRGTAGITVFWIVRVITIQVHSATGNTYTTSQPRPHLVHLTPCPSHKSSRPRTICKC